MFCLDPTVTQMEASNDFSSPFVRTDQCNQTWRGKWEVQLKANLEGVRVCL